MNDWTHSLIMGRPVKKKSCESCVILHVLMYTLCSILNYEQKQQQQKIDPVLKLSKHWFCFSFDSLDSRHCSMARDAADYFRSYRLIWQLKRNAMPKKKCIL